MTYEQFWEKDCQLVKFYRQAQKIKDEQRDCDAWLQGLYFYSALCNASPLFRVFGKGRVKADPYESEPFTIALRKQKKQTERERQKRNGIEFMLQFAERFNKAKREKQKEVEMNGRS